jgi:hypothetical protein
VRSVDRLLIADQGYGDVIQFARYIPWAAHRCREVAVACSPEIRAVIARQPGVGIIFNQWQDAPEFAAFCPLSGLPRLAGASIKGMPSHCGRLVGAIGCGALRTRKRHSYSSQPR